MFVTQWMTFLKIENPLSYRYSFLQMTHSIRLTLWPSM
jgi:hypothetical protein